MLGDTMYLNVLGQSIIVLSSTKAVADLFEKRSAIYSSKMTTTMVHDLLGADWILSLMPYGDRWRRTRRMFHQYFNSGTSHKYHDIQLQGARKLLQRLKESPEKLFEHSRT